MIAAAPGEAVATRARVLDALRGVLDPELDESLVELDFVASVEVEGAAVSVELRLPTYWCAPNFTWLMAEDARRAAAAVPGVERVEVRLVEHHASGEISAGVSGGRTFEEVFPEEAGGNLDDLRALFRRKAYLARQERAVGRIPRAQLAGLRLGDLPPGPATDRYLEVRRELGNDCSPEAPALTDPSGRAVADPVAHLSRIRLMRVSQEGNAAFCRGLLRTRYDGRDRERGSG